MAAAASSPDRWPIVVVPARVALPPLLAAKPAVVNAVAAVAAAPETPEPFSTLTLTSEGETAGALGVAEGLADAGVAVNVAKKPLTTFRLGGRRTSAPSIFTSDSPEIVWKVMLPGCTFCI